MQRNQPIAVFDSGLGGISILRELISIMPNENYVYFGDSENAPYGSKPPDEIKNLTLYHSEKLIEGGAKALIIACNTATSVAINDLRELHLGMPIIGVEPALKPAVLAKENSNIIVMATPITLHELKFHTLMCPYKKLAHIIPLPCHNLAAMIESGIFSGDILDAYLKELFAPYSDIHIDSIVLGCTHYPFITEAIHKAFDYDVKIFDGSAGTANETKRRLMNLELLNDSEEKGSITISTSGNTEKFIKSAEKLLYNK